MCEKTPSFKDTAIWYFRNYPFSDEYGDSIKCTYLQNLFSECTGLKKDTLAKLFSGFEDDSDIKLSDKKTENSSLLSFLSETFGNPKAYTSITPEGGFIRANPGELSRAPFIQTIYASQQSTECLLITQFSFSNLYNQKLETDELNKIVNLPDVQNQPLQQIFFGAPGTGKSHSIKEVCKAYEHYRITFHPDTDYASFVGSYKPITEDEPIYHTIQTRDKVEALPVFIADTNEQIKAKKISYQFVQQAFLKAYIAAWKEQEKEQPQPVFLVIEEINRGNCAQIFGDIFQLLDRNEEGFSDYPIHADTDLSKELAKEFKDLNVSNAATINALYDGKDIVGEVKNGSHLLLPNNLYIWATMNTSDQSLFPIDSAFKRRWDWKYIKITDSGKGYTLAVNGNEYDWWDFLKAINHHIGTQTSQEDKKLGYFFVKATKNADGKHVISADKFLSKVLFFLYGDVYKDYGFDDVIFQGEDNKPMEFSDYFDENGNAVEPKIEKFLQNLGLKPKSEDIEDAEIIDSGTVNSNSSRALSVAFPDGITIQESTNFETYLKTIERIGLEKAQLIASQKTYVRRDEPLISKIQSQAIIDDPTYSYVQVGDYYVIKGIDARTQVNFINLLSEKLDLGLTVKY
ncbi:MAG: AAA domain-containing protein [Bacteroides sp.]|nr:AAA domain-containing protein [Bacteroides sp.]